MGGYMGVAAKEDCVLICILVLTITHTSAQEEAVW